MKTYKISTINKKSIEEVLIWNDDLGREIQITIGFRWGSVIASLNERDVVELSEAVDYNNGVEMYSAFAAELDYLDDGWYEDIEFIGDFTDVEKERLQNLWGSDSYSGLEEAGWTQSEAELWFFGPCEVELV